MAFPIIIIDSTAPGASDTQASGAGPGDGIASGSPLFGTGGGTSSDGLTVTLNPGTNLDNVAVDGSHVVYLADATGSARNFAPIIGKGDSGGGSANVTVSPTTPFGFSLGSKLWAIGGKRASFNHTDTRKLVDNVTTGDLLPGSTIRFMSGHVESYSGNITFRRPGAPTTGRITIEGEAGAAVMPTLTQIGNFNGLNLSAQSYLTVQNLRFRNTVTGTKSSATAVNSPGICCHIRNCRCDDVVAYQNTLVGGGSGAQGLIVEDCYAAYTLSHAITCFGGTIRNNFVKNAGGMGFNDSSGSRYRCTYIGNVAVGCLAGLSYGTGTTSEDGSLVANNVFHGNATGIVVSATPVGFATLTGLTISSNNITGNTTYGINFNGAGADEALARACGVSIRYNNFGTGSTANTSGDVNTGFAGLLANSLHVDPGYVDAANDNFMAGPPIRAQGFPQRNVGVISPTRSYFDIGIQRQEPIGGTAQYLILSP